MGVKDIPYGTGVTDYKYKNAKWYQGLCEAVGKRPVSCGSGWGSYYNFVTSAYNSIQAYSSWCNPSSYVGPACGWSNILTFHSPPKSTGDTGGDNYGVCGNGCTINDPKGWTPVCTD
jgi:hypothetical protein